MAGVDPYTYPGQELALFAQARHWKAYWAASIGPWVRGDVLEVGAGEGANIGTLMAVGAGSILCAEPDPTLFSRLQAAVASVDPAQQVTAFHGTLADLPAARRFNTILYIDVLEHIRDEAEELKLVAERLSVGGHLLVVAPAHPWLFSAFDRAVGHYRRYSKADFVSFRVEGLDRVTAFYLDSVGMAASLANRWFVRRPVPDAGGIRLWDRVVIPLSRVFDLLTFHCMGKSLVGVWRRSA